MLAKPNRALKGEARFSNISIMENLALSMQHYDMAHWLRGFCGNKPEESISKEWMIGNYPYKCLTEAHILITFRPRWHNYRIRRWRDRGVQVCLKINWITKQHCPKISGTFCHDKAYRETSGSKYKSLRKALALASLSALEAQLFSARISLFLAINVVLCSISTAISWEA
jgi:hypothetical protein